MPESFFSLFSLQSVSIGRRSSGFYIIAVLMILSILFAFALFTIFKAKIYQNAINTKKLILMLERKDSAWKYTDICKRATNTYFAVQKILSSANVSYMSDYITNEFSEEFKGKLLISSAGLKSSSKYKLKEIKPISVYDDTDDTLDHVWFYVNGKSTNYSVDSILDTQLPGNDNKIVYSGEYWQFVRGECGWMLNKIISVNEVDDIRTLSKL